jgi:taurine dioxygenase
MQVKPLTCAIGAELVGVNLADAIKSDDLFAEIRAQLLKHRVVFLRDQTFSRAEHVAFARRFGELEDHPVAGSDPEHPGLVRIYKSPDQPNDRYENAWHSDTTWREAPQFGAVLRCVECPPVGGDTMWANMALAYENLPDHIKSQIADLRARHSIEASFGAVMPIEKRLALKALSRCRAPRGPHPSGHRREDPLCERLHHALHELPHSSARALRSGWQPGRGGPAALPDLAGLYP